MYKFFFFSKEELESKAPDIVEIGIDLKEFYKSGTIRIETEEFYKSGKIRIETDASIIQVQSE